MNETKLPPGWRRAPISETWEGLCDGPHATPTPADEGPVFLGIGNITDDGHLDLGNVRHISEADYPKWTRRVEPREGDIVFTYEATLNRYAIIPRGFRGCLGRRLALIRPDRRKVDSRFLFYSFFAADWRETIERNRLAGATVDRIPIAKFPDFPINLPPLEVQHRIAGILSAYDDLIEVNTRRIAILEEMALRLFDEWFVQLLYPGRQMTSSVEVGELPQGWRNVRLSEIADVNSDTISPRNAPDSIHYIDISSVSPGTVNDIRTMNFADAPGRARRRVKKGDVLWSTVRPNRRSHALLLHLEPDTIASTGFAVLRAKAVPWSYLYLAVTTDQFVAHLEGRARGSAYPAVVASDFEAAVLRLPPSALLEKFDRHVAPLFELASTLRCQAENLRAARDLLLPKLISGEIDLEQAERNAIAEAAE